MRCPMPRFGDETCNVQWFVGAIFAFASCLSRTVTPASESAVSEQIRSKDAGIEPSHDSLLFFAPILEKPISEPVPVLGFWGPERT
jgi:hypothetical protein